MSGPITCTTFMLDIHCPATDGKFVVERVVEEPGNRTVGEACKVAVDTECYGTKPVVPSVDLTPLLDGAHFDLAGHSKLATDIAYESGGARTVDEA